MNNKPIPWVRFEKIEENAGRFVTAPLKRGMGITLGNSLRRVLLSSLSGIAITAVRIDGVDHEFSVIPNVKEDVLDIICNLKTVVLKGELTDDIQIIKLVLKDKKKIYAKDIQCPSGVSVVNKDHYICEVTAPVSVEMELTVEKGEGYCSAELNKKASQAVNTIHIDSSFSPIYRVNHQVDNIRVGKELDYESLTLEVWTNGSISPENAIRASSDILIYHIELFRDLNKKPEAEPEIQVDQENRIDKDSAVGLSIDDLELSARSSNCLKRAGIETVGQLIEKDLSDLIKIKNFGKKSADEINDKLKQYGLCLNVSENSDMVIENVEVEV